MMTKIVESLFKKELLRKKFFATVAGAIIPLSFAPVNIWLAGLIGVFGLCLAIDQTKPKQAFIIGCCFGIGLFGTGASWIYVSVSTYGNVNAVFAVLITFIFILVMSLFTALQCWGLQRFFSNPKTGTLAPFAFASTWALSEWIRSWFLTGFPWLFLGYGHIHSPLKAYAPVFGIFGIGFIVALSASLLFYFSKQILQSHLSFSKSMASKLAASFIPWLIALGINASDLEWVTPSDEAPLSVGIVHGTVTQEDKFRPGFELDIVAGYEAQTAPLWGHDLILWPETAIPMYLHRASDIVDYLNVKASDHNSTLISGIFYLSQEGLIHNSILSMGNGDGIYHKQNLVPFGEYIPLLSIVGPLFKIFDLPMSTINPGPDNQGMLSTSRHSVAPFICYEVVYPDLVRKQARFADILVTISNDTWFGASWGPKQHLQMASMRALENGRYMLRSTNNGLSAIIDEKGNIITQSTQFESQVISGEARTFSGNTPYSNWGSWPVLLLVLCLLCGTRFRLKRLSRSTLAD